ncbi:MAG: hypothetical protein IKE38_01970 [Erysipelotrichaceae bacterium]|nr:hypothetical protein [Erysipelotrichaceae bacterium]
MEYENEITVEIAVSLKELTKLLEDSGFELLEEYDLNDIYMADTKAYGLDSYRCLLNRCLFLRDIILKDKEIKKLTYITKEYDDKGGIIRQGKISCVIDDIAAMKQILEASGYEEFITINDHMLVYGNGSYEMAVQLVNGRHIYIEIEDKGYGSKKEPKTIEELKETVRKYRLPVKSEDCFVKKAEIEAFERYGDIRNYHERKKA